MTDKAEIRRRLQRDRAWSVYALADLDDGMFEHCRWWAGPGESLGLVFTALSIRPIFVIGDTAETRHLLTAIAEPRGYLNLQPHQRAAAEGLYAYRGEPHHMNRMLATAFQPRAGETVALTLDDLPAVEALYATGDGGGIAFAPFQLATGAFRGIRRHGELVAVAGVHVLSPNESVAGVGNVFVHPGHRGQGLAQIVTSAVVSYLLAFGIETIGLNVEHDNLAAIAAYRRIGFQDCFHYFEGVADRLPAA